MDSSDKQEPIAIVGAACRFAGDTTSLDSLWDMVSKVKTGHCPVPGDRWDSKHWYHPDPNRKGGIAPQHGYFIQQDISRFDAPFFSITAKEAAAMDPMKRLLLEVSYESIENAGILVEDLMNSRTGCYVGCMTNDYEMTSLHDIYDIGHTAASATSEAMTANRVSWFFGLKGPSLTLDTACSSSLYALHLACQSLRLKETNMSLVAGVNLMINPNTMHQLAAMHMLSPEGISHTFDDRANGYGRGDGIGAVIVKRLSDAIRDGDTIRAVIRGSGANADGKTPSITQPSSISQAELINQTYEDAGLDQSETTYCEAHGTGTPVGDPLELTAIASTLGAARRQAGKTPLYVGSIKPTIGHTEGCAGLAGVLKAVLLLEKGKLVPTYGVERVNPKLKLSEWNLALPQETMSWPEPGIRRVSVNSFGFGGANAHIILDDAYHYLQEKGLTGKHNTAVYPVETGSSAKSFSVEGIKSGPKRLFLFSGKDQTGATRVFEGLQTWLQNDSVQVDPAKVLPSLAYTLGAHRTHLENRTFSIASSPSDLVTKSAKTLPAVTRAQRHGENLVMIFTGQGAQWPQMGRELFENTVFRQSIEDSQSYLTTFGCTWDAWEELNKKTNSNIDRPEYSQPLCTVIQVALIDLLRFWKILPTATIGHSSGEIAAAYAANLLTHIDAIKLAYVRGLSSAAVSKKGAMLAAGLSQADAQVYLDKVGAGSAVVACINSPVSVTISGDVDAINQLETLISNDGRFARKLKVTTAYHSHHMREVSPNYLALIGEISPVKAERTSSSPIMFSSLTGAMVSSAKQLDAQYWVDNMQNPVQFSQGFLALLKHKKVASGGNRPVPVQWGGLLEIGPHAALQGPLRQIIDASNNKFAKSAPYASMLVRGKDAIDTSLGAAGTLWAAGYKVDMMAINQHSMEKCAPQMLCDLPAYPWNHSRGFWHESYSSRSYRFPPHVRCDFLGMPEDSQSTHEPRWRNYLRVSESPWIEDHTITGTVLYPAAGMLVMALEGVLRTADPGRTVKGFRLTDVTFERGMVISLDDTAPVETRISFHSSSKKPDSWEFTIFSMTKGSLWIKHCAGTVGLVYEQEISEVEEGNIDAMWQRQLALRNELLAEADCVAVDTDKFYKDLDNIGMQYGPTFRNVNALTAILFQKASFGTVAVPDTKSTMPKQHESPHVIHPATLDSIFHLVLASLNTGRPVEEAAVPYSIEEMYIARDQPKGAGALYAGYGRLLSQNGHELATELVVSDQQWAKPKLTVKNFALRQVTSGDGLESTSQIPSGRKNCAGITWTPNADFLTSNEDLMKLVTSKKTSMIDPWLDSVFLKNASTTALVVLFDESESSINILRCLKSRTYGPAQILAFATSESSSQLMRSTLGEGTHGMAVTYNWLPQSELLEKLAPEANDLLIALGVPDIAENAATLAKLAPLVCITYPTPEDKVDVVVPGSKYIAHLAHGATQLLFASSTTSRRLSAELPDSVTILLPPTQTAALSAFSILVQTKLESIGVAVARANLTSGEVASLAGKSVISLLEIESPLVYSWSETEFLAFKTLVSTVRHLFWITRGSLIESWSNGIEFATSQGLLRVMRNEYPIAMLPSLDLSAVLDVSNAQNVDLVLDVWQTSLHADAEMEYAECNGLIHSARAIEEPDFDYELELANNIARPTLSTLGAVEKPLKASVSSSSQQCIWIPDEQAVSPLGAYDVEVKVEYAGLGSGKTLSSVNHAVGIVARRGAFVKEFQIGQRVVVLAHSTARTHIRVSQASVAPLSSGLDPTEAAALVAPLLTAQYSLTEIAHLSYGQTVLLDNAASVVGNALMRVAKAVGAEVFALVHSKAERDSLEQRFGIAKERIFDSELPNFVPLIQGVTQNCGVDLVVSQGSGPQVIRAMSVMSDYGHFIDLSSGSSRASIPASKSNASLTRIDMYSVIRDRPTIVGKLFQQAFRGYNLQHTLTPRVHPVTDLAALIASEGTEQVVVSLQDTTPVLVPAPQLQELKLESSATYVLAGGLGALGLDVANWMIDHGARDLVFLSRSGGSKNQKDLQKFIARSARAEAVKCDVNDAASVASVFDTLKAGGRRVAGVIQMAMVLEDAVFENMSFEQWRRAIEPKTKGSRNLLANIWPDDKPFFILLSSITGVIGNTAQANYASGNTFEDALAHHARNHLGINATSIDVGLVSDSSHFTAAGEFGDLASYLGRYQHGWRGMQTTLGELGVAMRAIMRGSFVGGKSAPAQVVLGLSDRIERNADMGGFSTDKKFELRVIDVGNSSSDGTSKVDVRVLLSNARSMTEATAVVEDDIRALVAAAMGVPLEEVDAQRPLYDYGVDSLQAVEIRNRVLRNMKSEISVFDLLSAMPVADLAIKIADKSQFVKVAATEE